MNVNSVTGADGTLLAAGTDNSTQTAGVSFNSYMGQASQSSGDYLEQIFEKAADIYNVSKDLLKAMAKAESNFNAGATSHCGAMGIMQLMPSTAASLGVTDAYDPEQNIMGGAKYISRLLEKYNGNVSYALAAYNAGSGNVDKYGGIPPFKETQNYVTKIMRYLEEGVTIPGSSTAGVPSGYAQTAGLYGSQSYGSSAAGTSSQILQQILNQYFDYDDYLEFLQLFTKILYEKIAGTDASETDTSETNASGTDISAAGGTAEETGGQTTAEPVKRLMMKIQDAEGKVNTYQQDTAGGEINRAFQYMTSGGQNRMAVFLNKSAEDAGV